MSGPVRGGWRTELEQRYLDLVRRQLPAAAREGGWVLREDHCFGRVLLDDAVDACWYDVLDRRWTRSASSTTTSSPVRWPWPSGCSPRATLLRDLDARSLAWRGKPQKQGRCSAPDRLSVRGPRPTAGR